MKPILPTAIVFTLATMPMFAGKRITFEVTDLTTNKTSPRVLLLDPDRLKFDEGNTVVMFLTKGGNRLVMLDKKTNTYREMDQAYMDQMSQQMGAANAQMQAAMKGMTPEQQAQMQAAMAQMMKGKLGAAVAAQAAPTTYTPKGSGTVAGYTCTNYEGMKQGAKVSEVCAAQPTALKLTPADFQVLDKIRQFTASLTSNLPQGFGNMVPRLNFAPVGINGMPIESTEFENGKAVDREQLKSITDTTFTDADFSTGNATKQEMPMPTAGRGKGKGK